MFRRIGLLMVWGGGISSVTVPLVAAVVDLAFGVDAILLIDPFEDDVVAVQKWDWEEAGRPRDRVAAIYGNPSTGVERILFPEESRLFRPEEDPALTLLKVYKSRGENPLQAQTLWFAVRFILLGCIASVFAGAGLPALGVNPAAGRSSCGGGRSGGAP